MDFYGDGIDKLLYEQYFKDVYNGFFVECGASNGMFMSVCRFFEETMGWSGINIEPVPEYYNELTKNRPHCRNLNLALSNTNSIKEFTNPVAPNIPFPGWGSLSWNPEFENSLSKHNCRYDKFNVITVLFSDIFTENREIDLFVLDVEGHEIEALEGILTLNVKYLPKVMCIETSLKTTISDMLGDKYKEGYNDFDKTGNIIYRRTY